ncbi:D-psicose/D-tagatose/L-ribulose 3-epimerase [Diaminobutyricimonas aerilata]|uniref:D-psicose/D-tagatose/L-ribulose 3-epimerase n=1 Tax=Diaminobutyricimonas aerilata TaxID=1162967 RepID=A0A2M9CGD4_9MICO|nr:sugar phosphate isomerase/epimerase [Diaminobutyricimonas aerilata]PJJ70991.1 D-psicose/D-tagatose/L-ribulose 3-epimerase [Diaminobutyricimonas aerilata]
MPRILGVNTWVWTSPLTDESLDRLARHVASLGFDAIELPLENPGDWDARRARDLLDELGLAGFVVGAMAPGRDLVASDRIGETQEYLRECIRAAEVLGSPVVAGPFYASTGRTWRMTADERGAIVRELRESLAPVADAAVSAGVRLGIEPLNRYETSLVNTVDQALDALDPLLGRGVGLALDTYHLNIEEKSITGAIAAAGEHIVHVQVCGNDRGAVGDDHLDWPAILAALDGAGYDDALTLESFTGENASIATAASIWRPLAETQDALATRSLTALRRLTTDLDTYS